MPEGFACNPKENLPVKTCQDNFIIIEDTSNSNEPSGIEQKNNCVFIKENSNGLLGISDEFLFKILGVED